MSRRLLIAVLALLIAVAALGYYVGRLKRHAEIAALATPEASAPIPASGSQEHITIYVPNDSQGSLMKRDAVATTANDSNSRARAALRALLSACRENGSPHPISGAPDIDAVFIVDNNLAVIDANAALSKGHASGIMVEQLTVAAMAETLAANVPGITRVKLLVDGKDSGTLAGHLDLNAVYDIATFKDWIAQ
jgi:spore germination protein GerM